ncbi:MAG TPA: hypothetical protein VFD23_00275 [Clostridia bacterium]|nr:hypothetical protein [Clostridia bacterium]
MSVSFNGYKESLATFKAANGLTAGVPVKMSANGTVDTCAAGDNFCGVASGVGKGYASVQMSGFITLPYTGATPPAVGYTSLAADGSGGVKVVTDGGRSLLVLEVDTTAKTAGFMLG